MSSKITTNKIFNINADGSLTLHGTDFKETIRPWGHSEGFGVEGCKRSLHTGQQEPLLLLPALESPYRASGPIRCIINTIPVSVLEVVQKYLQWQVEHLQMAERNVQGYLNLSQQNPALLNLLASYSANCLMGPRHYGDLLHLPQKKIARNVGLHGSWAKYLSQIDVDICTYGYLQMALTAIRQRGMERLLSHVKDVNLDVMLLAMTYPDIASHCPSLLHLAAYGESTSTVVFDAVTQITSANQALRRPRWVWRRLHSLEQLSKIHERVSFQALKQGVGNASVYPAPPLSPCSNWEAITDSDELQEFARVHANCGLQQNWKLVSGRMAIYVSRRCSLDDTVIVVVEQNGGTWGVSDVLGTQNSLVETSLEAAVRDEFDAALGGAK
jgi:hypothetical protein